MPVKHTHDVDNNAKSSENPCLQIRIRQHSTDSQIFLIGCFVGVCCYNNSLFWTATTFSYLF